MSPWLDPQQGDWVAPLLAKRRAALEAMSDPRMMVAVVARADTYVRILREGGRLWFLGNGGAAATCSHIAAEYVGRFTGDREALPAAALTADHATLTALANDYGYPETFERLIAANVREKDLLILHSTSGHGLALVNAAHYAFPKYPGRVVALLGRDGGMVGKILPPWATITIPGEDTATIQEMQLLFEHLVCQVVNDRYEWVSEVKRRGHDA